MDTEALLALSSSEIPAFIMLVDVVTTRRFFAAAVVIIGRASARAAATWARSRRIAADCFIGLAASQRGARQTDNRSILAITMSTWIGDGHFLNVSGVLTTFWLTLLLS